MLARLFCDLAPFNPTLIGTYPLGLAIEGSDIDIACSCADLDAFERALREVLAGVLGRGAAHVQYARRGELDAVVAAFAWEGTEIELFAQARPVTSQHGFRHMIVEGRLLAIGGDALRAQVRARKVAGEKTEPAFAALLGLEGDPYAALLALEDWPVERLRRLVDAALGAAAPVRIEEHVGPRDALWPLFRIADDSDREIAAYLPHGRVLVALVDGALVGHVQMIDDDPPALVDTHASSRVPGTWELKSLAVVEAQRGTGLGRRLVEAALELARGLGAQRVVLSTGAADCALLRFYQRRGFRFLRVERDIFTPAAGYPADLFVDGIRLLDRVWFDRNL